MHHLGSAGTHWVRLSGDLSESCICDLCFEILTKELYHQCHCGSGGVLLFWNIQRHSNLHQGLDYIVHSPLSITI